MAKIHIAKKQLGLDNETYREMLKNVTGKDSAKDLTAEEINTVMISFRKMGFGASTKKPAYKGRPHTINNQPMLQKIEALLADNNLSWAYADGIARNMFQVQKIAWLRTEAELKAVIAALDKEVIKRRLKIQLDDLLAERDLDESWVEENCDLPKRGAWQRNRRFLETLIEELEGQKNAI